MMKQLIILTTFFSYNKRSGSLMLHDSTGTLKATKEYLMSEEFYGNSSYIFNSLSNADG
jgi:hypothetical protein